MASATSPAAWSPCTCTPTRYTLAAGQRRRSVREMSRMAAPVGLVTTPMARGKRTMGFL